MKAKSSGGSQGYQTQGAHETTTQKQPQTLTSNQAVQQSTSIYLLSSSHHGHQQHQKDMNTKSPYKMTTVGAGPTRQQQQAVTATKAQQMNVSPFGSGIMGIPLTHPSQQLMQQTASEFQHAQSSIQQQQQQIQSPMKNATGVKTVNLSFTGTDFAHRNMQVTHQQQQQQPDLSLDKTSRSASLHNGFYLHNNMMVQGGGGHSHLHQAQQTQQAGTGSLRSLGRQPQVGASLTVGHQNQAIEQNANFSSTAAQGVFTTLHMPGGSTAAPGQKKNVSSKNQQRRKISATINQSTQFQNSANSMIGGQPTVTYPQSMKKKSSKGKMLLADGNQMIVPVLQSQHLQNNQGQMMVGRAQSYQNSATSKLQSSGLKQSRLLEHDENDNLFIHQQQHEQYRMRDNIFAVSQSPDGNTGPVQIAYQGNTMQGYIVSKQHMPGGIQTPNSGYKQISMLSSNMEREFTGDPNMIASRYGGIAGPQGNPGAQQNIRAKTLGPNNLSLQQMIIQQTPVGKSSAQRQSESQQPKQLASAQLNKNYMKVAPQYEISLNAAGSASAKQQQRSFQSLQAQQLSMLNQAVIGGGPSQVIQQQPILAPVSVMQQQQQQAAFVQGRKLVSMKPSNGTAMIIDQSGTNSIAGQDQPPSVKQQMTIGQRISMPAVFEQSLQKAPEQSVQQIPLEPLVLQKLSGGSHMIQSSGKPLILNQAQIQFVRERSEPVPQNEQVLFVQQQQLLSASKNTNLIVRIDNSNAANHQITKRKRLKDAGGPAIRNSSQQNNHTETGAEDEQLAQENQQPPQRRTVYVDNVTVASLPSYHLASASASGAGYQPMNVVETTETICTDAQQQQLEMVELFHQNSSNNKIKEAMANSQQNFNSNQLSLVGKGSQAGARNATHMTADSMMGGADNDASGLNAEMSQSARNNEHSHGNKPSSAMVNTRIPINNQRPDSKQDSNGNMVMISSAKKRLDRELAARDALIEIDDVDGAGAGGGGKIEDHYQDGSEADQDSQVSGGDHSHSNEEQTNFQFNKSVDGDKSGKSGSFSYRQGANTAAGLKVVQQNSNSMQGSNAAATQSRFIDSDVESEQSGSAAQQRFGTVPTSNREANYSQHNLASDSDTDGNFSDTGSCFGRGTKMGEEGPGGAGDHQGIDGISEHSSDLADSESGPDADPFAPKKKEKAPGEKPTKRKKKKAAGQDEKGTTTKKVKGVDKENAAKAQQKHKEKGQQAPAKKNFTEVKEKEYHAKSKTKGNDVQTKAKAATQAAKDKQKPDKDKSAKGADSSAVKVKKSKQAGEESKGGAAAEGEVSPQKKGGKPAKPQKPSLSMQHTNPKNLEEQKQMFFDSGCTINPVFEYENYAATQKFIAQFKEPSDESLLVLAKRILDGFIQIYGSESNYEATEGEIVPRDETFQVFQEYSESLGIEDWLRVEFKADMVPRTSFTAEKSAQTARINIRDPPHYPRGCLLGAIDHEIGTHALRKYNEMSQKWYRKREKYELKYCHATEEGFACVNQLVRTAWDGKHPFLYSQAQKYYAVYMASKMSFVDLFNDLEKYIDGAKRRWEMTCRVKRGMVETSEPGGLYKDQCYLEGAVEFLKHRHSIDIIGLFTGKISLDDLKKPKIQTVLNKKQIKLPTFVQDMQKYMAALDIIARTNNIETLPPPE